MIGKALAGYRRVARWVRCHVLGRHAYDWQEVFEHANETGEVRAKCGDCGREGEL